MKKWLDKYQSKGEVKKQTKSNFNPYTNVNRIGVSESTNVNKNSFEKDKEAKYNASVKFQRKYKTPVISKTPDNYNTPSMVALRKHYKDVDDNKKILRSIVKGADVITDIMQLGNFSPEPIGQTIGEIGNIAGMGVDAFQVGMDLREGDYGNAAINAGSVILPSIIQKYGYKRDMFNTTPGSYADKIANLGNRNGKYIPLTPYIKDVNNPVIMKGINFNRTLLGALGAETIIDLKQNGGLVSKNSLNRKVTCSNCGWSWKLSDGGEDPLTCHKCGGTIKMKHGGELDEYKEKGEVKSTFNPYQQNKPIVDRGNFSNIEYTKSDQISKQRQNATNKRIAQKQLQQELSARKAKEKGAVFTLPTGATKKYKDMNVKERSYVDAQVLKNKGRWNENQVEQPFLNTFNPITMLYDMGAGLGEAPLMSDVTNSYIPYVTGVGAPLVIGRLAGIGAKNTGQFVNNLVNPLAGTGEVFDNLGNKYLPNAYKINPLAFKTNSNSYYRMLGEDGLNDLAESQIIRSNQNTFFKNQNAYFSKGNPIDGRYYKSVVKGGNYKGPYMAEVKGTNEIGNRFARNRNAYYAPDKNIFIARDNISINNPNLRLYKQDWLRGYQPINKSKIFTKGQPYEGAPHIYQDMYPINKIYYPRTVITDAGVKNEILGLEPTPIFPLNTVEYPARDNKFLNQNYSSFGKMEKGRQKQEGGAIITNRGQWDYPGQTTIIPSNEITMQGVPYPVLGVDNLGNKMLMQPEMDYTFPGQYVTEYPMAQNGKEVKKDKIKQAFVTAYNNYNNRVFPAETLPIRQKAFKTINPSDYTDLRNYGRWVADEQRDQFYDPRSEEAFKFYLGLNKPEELQYLKKSKYKPTINATDQNYYSVDSDLEQDIFNSFKDKLKLNEILQTSEAEFETPLSGKDGAGLLGRFGVSRGHDENGDYLSYYDKYDLKDFAQSRTKGIPYSIYNRIYYPKKQTGGEMIDYKSGGQHGGLDRWFAEKWVDIKTGEPCGRQKGENRKYPACRPSKRISSDTPKTASELSSAERQKFKQEKTSSQRISYNHNRKEYGGENIDNMNYLNYMKSGGNVPTNPELYSRVKSEAKSKFNSWPSAYGSAWLVKTYKSRGGGYRKAEYGMEVMGNGGVPTNPGFVALPEYVQQNIINNMATGGQKMPPQLAYARFAAAGNLNQLGRYGYQDGGEEEVYWRTKQPMVNDPSMDAISKVLLQRNIDKNFIQRAAGFGNQNGIPTRYIDGQDPDSNNMSNLLMGFGDNYVSPTIIETFPNFLGNNSTMLRTAPGQLSYQPNQIQEYIKTPTVDIADYFATKGYKRAANDMYGMQYQDGGGKVPNDFNKFQEFNKTLPDNLRDDNFKYGDYSHYDLYGMWDASGKPKSFDDVKDTEIFPLQEDGYYHGFSVGNDGIWLKPKSHPSAFMEYMVGQLDPNSYDHVIQREDGRLQYVPNNYITKKSLKQKNETDIPQNINPRFMYSAPPSVFSKGGESVTLNAGGENHKIYVKTTNRGEGEKGHIMVNHPTMDKGMWDTIDLTEKSGATTIAQGVAATKKWHRENPYMKEYGGDVPMYANGGSFKESFRKARANNKSNFVYNGKVYNTDLKKIETVPVKTINSNPYAFTNKPIIENTNPIKRKPIVQNVWINPRTGLPMTMNEAAMSKAQQIAQSKNSGSIRKTVPTNTGRRMLDVVSNPMTSVQQAIAKQPITGKGSRNIYDNALDIINPITYAKAIKNTTTNVVHPIETLKKLGNTGLGTLQYITEGNTSIPVGEGYGVLFDALMTAQALKGVNNVANNVSTNLRDAKFNNTIVTKKGNTVKNSKEFFKQHDGKPLTQKERNFLNKELEQRGILEAQRKNVLNPIPNLFKKGVVAEDYNIKKVIKDFIPNIIKGQKYVDSQYEMGDVRINALDQWLGIPTKNTAYRIHSNSFKNGNDLVYTIPEKNVNYNNENLSKFNKQQLNNINAIDNYYRNPTQANKKILYKAMSEENIMTEKYKDFDPDKFLKNPDNTYGMPILLENKTIVPTYDYITGTGGGAPIIKEGNKITLKDIWDIQPFSRSTKLPEFIRNTDVSKLIGSKNFQLNQTYRTYPYGIKQTYNEGGNVNYKNGGGIPERYRNMGFTNVGAKKQSTRPGKKWMVLAKKGDDYKVIHGGYKGMQDFKQHHSEQRKENFWSRMGGRNSSKATDPFSPLYWHKRFGTWEYGGQPMAVGGQNVMNPIVKKDNRNWLEYLKN